MAIARGQTDRFGNPIPANPGSKIFVNSDGSVLQQRETVKLDPNIVASDDADTQATVLSIVGTIVTSQPFSVKGNSSSVAGPVADILDSGSGAGRVDLPILIDTASIVSASSYASPSWTAGLYRSISFTVSGTAVANQTIVYVLRSIAANYFSSSVGGGSFATTDNSNVSTLMLNTSFAIKGIWEISAGTPRIAVIHAMATPYGFTSVGGTITTSGGATGLDITFPQPTTATIRITGIPA